MSNGQTVAELRKQATPENSVEIGYEARKDGIILKSVYGHILIPASKMEKMHADMLVAQRQAQDIRADGSQVVYRGPVQR